MLSAQNNLSWQVQVCLPHIPLLLLIKLHLYEDTAGFLFIPALWEKLQGIMIYTYWTKTKKAATVLAPAGVYFNEIQWDEI